MLTLHQDWKRHDIGLRTLRDEVTVLVPASATVVQVIEVARLRYLVHLCVASLARDLSKDFGIGKDYQNSRKSYWQL